MRDELALRYRYVSGLNRPALSNLGRTSVGSFDGDDEVVEVVVCLVAVHGTDARTMIRGSSFYG